MLSCFDRPSTPQSSISHRLSQILLRYWIVLFAIFYGAFVGIPFLAPAFMHIGLRSLGNTIYWIYSFLCHQLPERSFFLFGSRFTYSLAEIRNVWQNTDNPLILRQFVGNDSLGWKVAWSDRMVSLYMSIWFFALLWWLFRQKVKPLPWWGLVLLGAPMLIDGMTHLISDLAGIGQGFRDSNTWLALLAPGVFPPDFYAGDAWGSFNSIMRLLTGILFGLGVVWFGFPYVDQAVSSQTVTAKRGFDG